MPDLDKVELEYRQLQNRLIYGAFEGRRADPRDERRMKELFDLCVDLSAPDIAAA